MSVPTKEEFSRQAKNQSRVSNVESQIQKTPGTKKIEEILGSLCAEYCCQRFQFVKPTGGGNFQKSEQIEARLQFRTIETWLMTKASMKATADTAVCERRHRRKVVDNKNSEVR